MDLMDYRRKIIANSPHLMSASGVVVSFSDGADLPLKSLTVDIDPVQSGSGDPSPTNIRPISGWNGVKVTRTGKNLLSTYTPETSYNGVRFTVNDDGSVVASGTATSTANKSSTFIPPVTGEYKLTGCPANGSGSSYQIWIRDEATGRTTGIEDRGNGSTGTLIKGNTYKVFLRINNGYTANSVHFYPMLRLASEPDDAYEPYKGNTYNISLKSAGTVCGGTLNPLTGVLTAYPYYASYNGETLAGRWVSDRDKYVSGTTPTIGAQVVDMSGTGTEIQLTPHQIRSLYGNNTIFADTGNVALEYWAHP